MSEQQQGIAVQLEDLYKIIGEREVIRYYTQKEMDRLIAENDQLKKALTPTQGLRAVEQ
jgi:hypothetical protein